MLSAFSFLSDCGCHVRGILLGYLVRFGSRCVTRGYVAKFQLHDGFVCV